jgi:sodium-dependent phosphate cotransporter
MRSFLNNFFITSDGVFLFEDTGMEDWAVGLVLLAISLIILCSCLVFLVKILNSMMQGKYLRFLFKINLSRQK